MIARLAVLVDVRKAVASVEADRVRELAIIEAQEGGADAVTLLCRGMLWGASSCMNKRHILLAAVGNMGPLRALTTKTAREDTMIRAAAGGYVDVVVEMIEAGADIEARLNGATAIHRAAQAGCLQVVHALLERSANVNTVNQSGWTPLMYSAQMGHLSVVQALLGAGADVNAEGGDTTALI